MKKLLSALLCAAAVPAAATTPPAEPEAQADKTSVSQVAERVLEFTKIHADSLLNQILLRDRPVGNKSIPVPHFAINTPDNAFVMTIGGQINPIIGADMGNDLYNVDNAGINFVTNCIPVPAPKGKKSDFFINALNADVDFQIVGLGGTRNQITGYIKFGTDGISNKLAMKKAYIRAYGFTFGRITTLLADGTAGQPTTIDPQGPSGLVSGTMSELSYQTPRYKGFKAAIGLDIPTYYASSGRYYGPDYKPWQREHQGDMVVDPTYYTQNVPNIPVWVEWAASDYNRIRLSGLLRNFRYRDMINDQRRSVCGWGVMVSGNLNPVDPLILYLQAIYGKGIGTYIQDIAGLPLSFVPSQDKEGRMTPSPMMGFNLGATYNFTSKLQANAVVSEARIWDVGPYAIMENADGSNANNYKYALYAAGNVFYNLSSFFQVGLEYVWGHRKTWNQGGASDSRVQMQFMFTF